jgi:hexosaminidase
VQARRTSDWTFRLAPGNGPGEPPRLTVDDPLDSYALEVRTDALVCTAAQPAGLPYGLQTVCQLIRANLKSNALPGLVIRDWPSLRWRGFQDDMTRGPSSTLDTLKFEASLAAYLKLNLMTYYMEFQFAFRKHPAIGPLNGSLTPEDLSALVSFVKPLHLEILGNQQSFGHFGRILQHPEYAALRETPEVLTPVREETYQLLDDFYSEVCPLLPFPWFNVCCDETAGLGTGPSRAWTAELGVGGVYVHHLRRIHDLLRDKYGKRMMMWGDIILKHPDHLGEIPRDTIMLTWGYDARPSFEDQILPFTQSGFAFFVCPGVNNWSRILPDFGGAVTNIQNFVRDGAKHGALGMLNTDWEDDGEALNAVKWHADAWAAECSWNASSTPIASFNRRIGAVLFGESGDHFGQAVELLSRTHRLRGMRSMFNTRFWEQDFVSGTNAAMVASTASNLLALVHPALVHLEACRQEARCNQAVLDALCFGARRMELIGQRLLDGQEVIRLYQRAYATRAGAEDLSRVEELLRRNRDAHEALGRQFATLWLAESKPYALDWTLRRYTNTVNRFTDLLRKVSAAGAEARAGRPLPAPAEVGLGR